MPDPMIEIAKIIDSQIESRLAKFKKDIQKYVDNRRIGSEQIKPGAIIPSKLAPVPPSKFPQFQEIIDDMHEAIETAEQDVAAARTRIDGAESNLLDARNRLSTAETRLSDTEGNVSALQTTASMLSSDIMNAKGDISTLEQTAAGFTTAVSNAQGDISALQQTAQGLTSDVANSKGDISSLQQTATGLSTAITNAEGDISSLRQTASGLSTALANAEGDISTLEQTASSLSTAVTNAQNDISTIQQQADGIALTVQGKLDADDPSSGVETSGISISSGQVAISTPVFAVNVEGTNGDMSLDESGLSVNLVTSPSVAPVYLGPSTLYVNKAATSAQVEAGTHYRSISDAFAALDGMRIKATVTVNITNTSYYENPYLYGVFGNGALTINGNGATVIGRVRMVNMGAVIWWNSLNVSTAVFPSHGAEFSNCQFVEIAASKFVGPTSADYNRAGVLFENGTHATIRDCEIYGSGWRATISRRNSVVSSINNKGNQRHSYFGGAHLTLEGTQPSESTNAAHITIRGTGGVLHQPGDISVDMGSASPPEPEVATATFSATTSRTVHGSAKWPGSWLSTTDKTWQGYTNGNGHMATLLWFSGVGALAGKTIRSARLRLHRNAGSGKGSAVNVVGHYGARAYNAGSGSPNDRTSMGTLGNISEGDTKYFDIPTAAVAYLAGGASNRCIALHPLDSAVMSGKSYSANYCKYDGVGSAGIPVLEVTYEN